MTNGVSGTATGTIDFRVPPEPHALLERVRGCGAVA
jgi:hypothetical protein